MRTTVIVSLSLLLLAVFAGTAFSKDPGSRSLLQDFDMESLYEQIDSAIEEGWTGFMRDFEQRLREMAVDVWRSDEGASMGMDSFLQNAPGEEGGTENINATQQNGGGSITGAADDLVSTFRTLGEASLETVRNSVGGILGTVGGGITGAQAQVAPGN